MEKSPRIPLEKQFSIKTFEDQVDEMSHEQAQQMLKELYTSMIIKEETYKELIRHNWGLEPLPKSDE